MEVREDLLTWAGGLVVGFAGWLLRLERRAREALAIAKDVQRDLNETRKTGTPGMARLGREVQNVQEQVREVKLRIDHHEAEQERYFDSFREDIKELTGAVGELTGQVRIFMNGYGPDKR